MPRIILTSFLVILLTLVACSEATPAPEVAETLAPNQAAAATPTEAPAQGTTAAPMATPASTITSVPTGIPTQTATPTVEPQATTITPREQGEHVFVAAEYGLSQAELACFSESGDPAGLARALNEPGSATRKQQGKLLDCLEDDTLGKLFLSGLVGDSGPLSLETSTCIQAAFDEINPRTVMTAGMEGNPGAAMAGSMAAFSVTQACLTDEEWETSQMGISPAEREGMQCLMRELGGPADMAAAMIAAGQGDITTFSAAGMACGLDMGTGPSPVPTPGTATPQRPLEPTKATSSPTATPTPTTAPAIATPAPTQPHVQPTSTWRGITVAPENRCSPYNSDDYPYPPSVEPKIVDAQDGIYGPYTGTWFGSIRETDIEHIVARSEAHDSGLCAASPATKSKFSSDLLNLTLSAPSVNRHQKSANDVAEWLPDLNRCWYVDRTVQVRREYGLTIDRAEANAVDQVLAGCESTALIVLAPRRSQATSTPTTSTSGSGGDALALWDDNGNGRITCAEARAHGIAPVRQGHPAYQYMTDGDGDGMVCE